MGICAKIERWDMDIVQGNDCCLCSSVFNVFNLMSMIYRETGRARAFTCASCQNTWFLYSVCTHW